MTVRRIVIVAGLMILVHLGSTVFAFGQAGGRCSAGSRPGLVQESPLYGIRTSFPAAWAYRGQGEGRNGSSSSDSPAGTP